MMVMVVMTGRDDKVVFVAQHVEQLLVERVLWQIEDPVRRGDAVRPRESFALGAVLRRRQADKLEPAHDQVRRARTHTNVTCAHTDTHT